MLIYQLKKTDGTLTEARRKLQEQFFFFLPRWILLRRWCPAGRRDEYAVQQIVLPKFSRKDTIPMVGHLGKKKTVQRIVEDSIGQHHSS